MCSPPARLVCLSRCWGARREHNSQINLIANDFKMDPSQLSTGKVVRLREVTQTHRDLGGIHPKNRGWRGGAQAVAWGLVDLLPLQICWRLLLLLLLLWSQAPLLLPGPRWVLRARLGELRPERASIPPAAPPAQGAAPQNFHGQLGVGLLESSLH